jgi:arabinogalactan oligomer/maltooligosaccharide transport system permease protein
VRRLWVWLLLLFLPVSAVAAPMTVWHSYRGAEEAALLEASRVYTEETDVVVKMIAVPFGAFDAKVETAIPRGNGPDAFIAPQGSLGKWSKMGLLAPIDVLVPEQLPVTTQATQFDGVQYGVPLAFKSLLLLYNPTLVQTPPTTTDELLALAKRLRDPARGEYGLAWQAAEPYFHAPFMFGAGAQTHVSGAVTLDTPEHAVAYGLTQSLSAYGPTRPTGERVGQLYDEGKVAVVISGPWFVADRTRPIVAAPLPVVSSTGTPARPYLTVDAAFLTAGGDNVSVSRAFLLWLAGPKGAAIRANIGGQAVSHTGTPSADPIIQALAKQAEVAVPLPMSQDIAAVWESMGRALRRVQRGSTTPEGAAEEAQIYFNALNRPSPTAANPTPYLIGLGLLVLALFWRLYRGFTRGGLRKYRRFLGDYLWIAPAGIAVFTLVAVPFLLGASVAFFTHDAGTWTFVGLRNFGDILLSRDWPVHHPMSFFYTLGVTVLWTVTNVALHLGIGMSLALALREPWVRSRGLLRALLILPWAVPNYITALIWRTMFDAQYGAINAILSLLLARPVETDWFASFSLAFTANLVTNTWLGFPFMMVVTLGALSAIPGDLEEAAEIDGASYWQRLRLVVLPVLKPALMPAIILGSVWTFNMFNVIYLVSGGEPDGGSEILISEAYRWAFSRGNRYGYAAAYAVLIFGVLWLYSKLTARLSDRRVL